jgi:hypothetical protein
MNVVNTVVVIANGSQCMVIEAGLPELTVLAAYGIDQRSGLELDALHCGGNSQGMTWIDDGMPVIGKKDPGSEEESVVSPSRVERFCQLLEVPFRPADLCLGPACRSRRSNGQTHRAAVDGTWGFQRKIDRRPNCSADLRCLQVCGFRANGETKARIQSHDVTRCHGNQASDSDASPGRRDGGHQS